MQKLARYAQPFIDDDHYKYLMHVASYLAGAEEELEGIQGFERVQGGRPSHVVEFSDYFRDLVLGCVREAAPLQFNKHGFAPKNRNETIAFLAALEVLTRVHDQGNMQDLYDYVSIIDDFFTLAKRFPDKREVVVNAMKCVFQHILFDRLSVKVEKL
jgi:hypothetical protein